MTSPLRLAQDVLKKIDDNIDEEGAWISLIMGYKLKSKALGLLTAFINEKEFLIEYYHGRELDGKLNSRLEELRQAIDLLNKNGVKI